MTTLPTHVVIREVGMRDGLQSIALQAAGIPYARIMCPDQLLEDPHLKASGGLVPMQTDDGGSTDVVLLPLLMGVRRPLPRVGEHTDEVLARLAKKSAA